MFLVPMFYSFSSSNEFATKTYISGIKNISDISGIHAYFIDITVAKS